MDLETIRGHVENYLLDLPTETSALVDEWIRLAVRRAAERHNFRFMGDVLEATTVEDARLLIAKPDRWKEAGQPPWLLWQDGSTKEILWAPSTSDMVRMYGDAAPAEGNNAPIDAGCPRFILETDDELHVYPFPDDKSLWDDGNYRVRVPHWLYPEAPTADDDTNWLMTNMAFYVIFFAAAEGFLFNQDEQRAGTYAQKAEIEFTRGVHVDKRSRIPDRFTLTVSRGARGTGYRR